MTPARQTLAELAAIAVQHGNADTFLRSAINRIAQEASEEPADD